MCFCGEIRKILSRYPLLSAAMYVHWSGSLLLQLKVCKFAVTWLKKADLWHARLQITQQQIRRFFHRKNAEIFLDENICCGYSLEAPWRGASNEYPQHMFSSRNKKNIMWIPPLICSYDSDKRSNVQIHSLLTFFDPNTACTPISTQSNNSVVFRLQPV